MAPYLGDFLQVRAVGYNFYGVFAASNDPRNQWPSGVYYQRNRDANGDLLALDNHTTVNPSIDPFFFYDIAPGWAYVGDLALIQPWIYDPGDPFWGRYRISWPVLPTNNPAIELQSSTRPAGAAWTTVTNFIETNGMFLAPIDASQTQQFFRLTQDVASGQFHITASTSANGSLSPSGELTLNGLQSRTFTASASNNYAIEKWYLDGVVVQSNSPTLTLSNIVSDHTVVVTFVGSNDLAVTMSLDAGSLPESYQTNTCSITAGNVGLKPLTGVMVTDARPANVSIISISASQGTVTNLGGQITASLGSLAPGALATVTFDFVPLVNGPITNSVMAVCNQPDSNLANNSVTNIATVIQPLAVTNQPASEIVSTGGTAIFAVRASGTAPLTYQWMFNGTNIAVGTSSSLTLTNVTSAQAGSYSVSVLQIFDPKDILEADSNPATLTVSP